MPIVGQEDQGWESIGDSEVVEAAPNELMNGEPADIVDADGEEVI